MMRAWLCRISALGLAVSATAASGEELWDERAHKAHVDQTRYSGKLDANTLEELIDHGETLFSAKFTTPDGVGRPMATQAIIPTKRKRLQEKQFHRTAGLDANSCASCHNDPVVGGAGDFSANVFVSEGFDNADFDTTDPQFSNERNTNHLMGAGLVELLAREMTTELHSIRRNALRDARRSNEPQTRDLVTKGVHFGQITAGPYGILDLRKTEGIDNDLVIRPFGQKGVMTSLRQFTVNALNHHHGMQADERFGARWTGESDFDEDGVSGEISAGDVSALVAWQATRPPPVQVMPSDQAWRDAAARGDDLFGAIGCASCHIKALPLETLLFDDPGPLDAAGTLRQGEEQSPSSYDLELFAWARTLPRNANNQIMVPLFSDLKRHSMTDRQVATLGNELLSQRFVERNVFQTSELWGIGSTAPYGHRGDLTTLDEVIRAHGGAGRESRDNYVALAASERSTLIAFLKTLVIAQ